VAWFLAGSGSGLFKDYGNGVEGGKDDEGDNVP